MAAVVLHCCPWRLERGDTAATAALPKAADPFRDCLCRSRRFVVTVWGACLHVMHCSKGAEPLNGMHLGQVHTGRGCAAGAAVHRGKISTSLHRIPEFDAVIACRGSEAQYTHVHTLFDHQ